MKQHMSAVHGKMKNFKCQTCGKSFSRKENLTVHIKAIHQMSRPHKCPDCDQSFTEAGIMRKHRESVHLNIRYPCTWTPPSGHFEEFTFSCNETFSRLDSLKRHIRQCHTRQHKYECMICLDKDIWWGCTTPFQLERHKKSQHPEEYRAEQDAYMTKHPYECKYPKCRKRFETEVERQRHQEKLH